jgi:hypothetical protein
MPAFKDVWCIGYDLLTLITQNCSATDNELKFIVYNKKSILPNTK